MNKLDQLYPPCLRHIYGCRSAGTLSHCLQHGSQVRTHAIIYDNLKKNYTYQVEITACHDQTANRVMSIDNRDLRRISQIFNNHIV